MEKAMSSITFPNSNNTAITMAAVIHYPEGFNEAGRYPAIIVSHPGGGVKEQASGTYARKLAERGFVTIAYDASYQGESGGTPRQLENPHIRTEDVSAVLDYLTTLPYVDGDRIGAMGICAGAGYTANAAINDRRIKAVGTVSMVNIGQMFRNGWENNVRDAEAIPYIQAGEYYHTARAQHPNAPGYATARSLAQIIPYDAFNKAEAFLTQPLKLVVGSVAGSKWMSDDLLVRASSADKTMHVVDGANHMDLYDGEAFVAEAVSVLAPFFTTNLARQITEAAE